MAPIPPSRRRGFQFRAEEIDDFLEVVETYLPISAQNWQTVADSHLENYPREQRTAESLRRKFQEISRRTGPTGDPTCPPYVIKAKAINQQLVQMIDASSGGSEAGRSEDGLFDGSGSDDAGVSAGEFANEFNNAARNGGGEEVDEEEDADGGVDAVVAPVEGGVRGDNGLRDAAGNAGRPRGPGRSRNVPARAAGVVGPPPAAVVVGAPPAGAAGIPAAPPLWQQRCGSRTCVYHTNQPWKEETR